MNDEKAAIPAWPEWPEFREERTHKSAQADGKAKGGTLPPPAMPKWGLAGAVQ